MIVEVATEDDVQKTILHANKQRKPFLALSGGHGTASTLGTLRNGVGIHLRRMNNITIVDDGQAALVQSGVLNGDLASYLWTRGKQTMTTGCDCVGYIAPILGGGHGWFQGRYGKAVDQLLSARLVLANGTAVAVSETKHSDLFWAIRGAGHNFGIVTEVKLKIYDVRAEMEDWAATSFVFTQDKLEAVFELANTWLASADRPATLTHYILFAFNLEVDARQPIIIVWMYYQGNSIPAQYSDSLNALSPVAVENSVTSLVDVNKHILATKDGASCAKGSARTLTPVSLKNYNIGSVRKVFEILSGVPTTFRTSIVMLEAYANNRVQEVDTNSTAYPDRDSHILVSPLLTYPANASLDATAFDIGSAIRTVLVEGSQMGLVAYVNYARGDESLEEIYGYEPWRLEKLRKLKKELDPFGRFNFFAPIS
ncbi:hypothetical protein N0V94_002918 [Neodidymelliopsis sp. IMI 364377]|nr:hypothetical protein N0V94_002918 [Neodidymelliopsis sp. IMI 364377]